MRKNAEVGIVIIPDQNGWNAFVKRAEADIARLQKSASGIGTGGTGGGGGKGGRGSGGGSGGGVGGGDERDILQSELNLNKARDERLKTEKSLTDVHKKQAEIMGLNKKQETQDTINENLHSAAKERNAKREIDRQERKTRRDQSNNRSVLQSELDLKKAQDARLKTAETLTDVHKKQAEIMGLGKDDSTKQQINANKSAAAIERIKKREYDTNKKLSEQQAKADAKRVRDEERAREKTARDEAKLIKDRERASQRAAREESSRQKQRVSSLREEAQLQTGIEKIETQRRAMEQKYANNPAQRQRLNALYDQRVERERERQRRADARSGASSAPEQRRTFFGDMGMGWRRAGGLGAAVGTIAKFTLAYKAFDSVLNMMNLSWQALTDSVTKGVAAMVDYEEQMAKASRTFRQPGMSRNALKDIFGRDALKFLADYRVTMEQVAQAQYELGSANFTAQQIMQSYQVPLKVNIALQGDLTQTTQLMTQMLKIHGEQMGENMSIEEKMTRLGGILYKTWEIEQVELSDLAAAYKYVAGSAAALKLPAEQLIPILGYLSTYGLRGSIGGTGLNQFFIQTARNIQITEDKITSLKKATRGMEHVITLKPGAYSPLELLIETSKSMQQLSKTGTGGLAVTKVLADMLNIRGARPAQLLSDMTRLGELLQNIKVYAKSSTEELKKMVEEGVTIMQLTPGAQWDIMQNKIYVIGVNFFRAATGAGDLVDAMVEVNKWLGTLINKAEMFGYAMNISINKMIYGFAEVKNYLDSKSMMSKFFNPIGTAAGVTTSYWAGRDKGQLEGLVNMSTSEAKKYLNETWQTYSAMYPGNPEAVNKAVKAEYMRVMKKLPYASVNLSDYLMSMQKKDAASKKELESMSNYMGIPKAGTSSGSKLPKSTAPKGSLWKLDSILGFKVSASQNMSMGGVHMGSHREPGVIDILYSEIRAKGYTPEQAASMLRGIGFTAALRTKGTKWPHIHAAHYTASKESARLRKQGWSAPSGQFANFGIANLDNQNPYDEYANAIMSMIDDKLTLQQITEQDAVNKLAEFATNKSGYYSMGTQAGAYSKSEQLKQSIEQRAKDIRLRQEDLSDYFKGRDTAVRDRNLAEYAKKLDMVTAKESLYGETIASINNKIKVQNEFRSAASIELEREQKNYNDLLAQVTLYQFTMSAFPYNEEVVEKFKKTNGELDASRDRIDSLTSSIQGASNETMGWARALEEIASTQAWDVLQKQSELNEAMFGGTGANYSLSNLKIFDIQARINQYRSEEAKLGGLAKDSDPSKAEFYQKQLSDTVHKRKLDEQEINKILLDRKDWMLDLSMQIFNTRSGWTTGSGKKGIAQQIQIENIKLAVEIAKMRRDATFGGANELIDKYNETMKAEIIAKPWRDAREQIESDWTDMFSNIFSELATGGNPFKAIQSFISSIQGQMTANFVKRNFGGLFDMLATQQTGLMKPSGDAFSGIESMLAGLQSDISTTGAGLNELTAQTNTASIALNTFASTLNIANELMLTSGAMAITGGGGGTSNIILDNSPLSLTSAKGKKALSTSFKTGLEEYEKAKAPKMTTKQNARSIGGALQNYSVANMVGGAVGSLFGYDAESSGIAGGLGYAAGLALGMNPVGAIALGLASIFGFGKKKKKQTQEPSRDIYGMPSFEWESYLYNYGRNAGKYGISQNTSLMRQMSMGNSVGAINININGGDTEQIKKTVDGVMSNYFGNVSRNNLAVGYRS